MKQFLAEVLRVSLVAKGYFELTFTWPPESEPPLPGQFLNIRCSSGTSPLLRRPFAFSGFDHTRRIASIIFEVRGQGTEMLGAKCSGDKLDIIGPLGNSFMGIPDTDTEKKSGINKTDKDTLRVLVSGGIGLGPIRFLARYLKDNGLRFVFIHGAREKALIPETEITEGLNTTFCTDDGSAGFHGTTTDYLESISGRLDHHSIIYACGPLPMLKSCFLFAEKHSYDCFVSMEQIMGCGFGACMGCVIKTKDGSGFARVCEEGPIFPGRSILWT
jgi:dihydroorotate dehydrogenase electron transfer subunit